MGCAVAATPLACQGVPVRDRSNALVGGSAESLAQCIVELIEDCSLRVQLGAAGREVVEREFTWEQAAESLRKVAGRLAVQG
jgi:glycosyltransferase involved in cell wall biosynthesis